MNPVWSKNSSVLRYQHLIMIEEQARYIARILQHALETGKSTIMVKQEVEIAYNKEIQKALKNTVWNSGCHSWYKDKNGHIFSLWPVLPDNSY